MEAGATLERVEGIDVTVPRRFDAATIDGWFADGRPLPTALAAAGANADDVAAIRAAVARTLTAGVPWRTRWALRVVRGGGAHPDD